MHSTDSHISKSASGGVSPNIIKKKKKAKKHLVIDASASSYFLDITTPQQSNTSSAQINHVVNDQAIDDVQSQSLPTQAMNSAKENNGLNSKTESVWSYASKIKDNQAQCNKCKKVLSCKDSSTTGIRKHLVSCAKLTQFTRVVKRNRSTINPEEKRRLNALATQCIIRDGRTFGDLRKPGIAKFINELLPG